MCSNCSSTTTSVTVYHSSGHYGWTQCNSPSGFNHPIIGYGFYQITNDEFDAYFYLDMRDENWGSGTHYGYGNIDYHVDYDWDDEIFRYHESPYYEIPDGTVLRIWEELNSTNEQSISCFPDFWENCLVLLPNYNSLVKLVWGPYDGEMELTDFEVYRAITDGSPPENFTNIATLDTDVYTYTDPDWSIGGSQYVAFYKVRAVYPSEGGEYTNEVNTGVWPAKRNGGSPSSVFKNFILRNNYPNPFNPSTTIAYEISERGYTTLEVYNALGQKVSTLVKK